MVELKTHERKRGGGSFIAKIEGKKCYLLSEEASCMLFAPECYVVNCIFARHERREVYLFPTEEILFVRESCRISSLVAVFGTVRR